LRYKYVGTKITSFTYAVTTITLCIGYALKGHTERNSIIGCLHDPASVQQTSSKRPALHLLEVCWTFAGSCKHPISIVLIRKLQKRLYNRPVNLGAKLMLCHKSTRCFIKGPLFVVS